MKKLAVLIIVLFPFSFLYPQEIVKIKLFDGDSTTGKLNIPANNNNIKELVIFVKGGEPDTYLCNRNFKDTNVTSYFDLYINEFNKRGIAFFTYNTRGVDIGTKPPLYEKFDKEKFQKAIPTNCVKDVESIIDYLKLDNRLKNAKVVLLGWSEGTIIAAMAADEYKNRNIIDALFLAGYDNDNLFDVMKWQRSGESQMIFFRKYFDKNNDSVISKEEFLSDDSLAIRGRKILHVGTALKDYTFKIMDVDSNNILTAKDFKTLDSSKYHSQLKAIETNDDKYLWSATAPLHLTSAWYKDHFKLEPNKTRLLRIDIPIYIFHGDEDANCPIEGVYDIKNRFAQNNKTNLQCFVFKGADHDLNYMNWITKKTIPEGIQKIFDISEELNK
jgi:hypothetical protein